MQGHTYNEEKDLGIIWSPQQDKGGNIPHSWKRMTEVRKGDRIFHYVKGNILAISIAREDFKTARKPSSMQNHSRWNDESYLVKLKYHELKIPVNVRDKFNDLLPLLPIKYSPFQKDSNGNQGYLYPCNEELANKILELISELNIFHLNEEQLELSVEDVRRTEDNRLIPVISETKLEVKAKI
jgi:putative restriction endonuclease